MPHGQKAHPRSYPSAHKNQAPGRELVWDALRRCGVNDPIPGFGRLLREF
jgi:maleate cis-trans isomerase